MKKSRASSPKASGRMSFAAMETLVQSLVQTSKEQHSLLQLFQERLIKTEDELNSSKLKIRDLQHCLAISNLRASSTVFHTTSWRAHKAAITSMCFVGDLLVTGSTDKSLAVWDLADGVWTEIQQVRGHTAGISLVQVTGDLVATASGDLTVKLWDPRLGWNCVGTLESHAESVVGAVCYVPRPKLLVTADRAGMMCVHDERGGFSCIVKRHTKAGGILSMTLLHPLSKFLVTSHNSGDIKIWDTASNFLEMRAIPKAHAGPIYKISMWRRFLVSAGSDKTVKFWNPETWTCVANGIGGHGKAIYDIITTSCSRCVAGVSIEDRETLDLDKETGAEVASVLATVGADGKLLFWDPLSMIEHEREEKNTKPMHHVASVHIPRKEEIKPQIITSGCFSPDGAVLMLADRSAQVHIFSGFASIYLCEPNGTATKAVKEDESLLLDDETSADDGEEESKVSTSRK